MWRRHAADTQLRLAVDSASRILNSTYGLPQKSGRSYSIALIRIVAISSKRPGSGSTFKMQYGIEVPLY